MLDMKTVLIVMDDIAAYGGTGQVNKLRGTDLYRATVRWSNLKNISYAFTSDALDPARALSAARDMLVEALTEDGRLPLTTNDPAHV